jgi:Ca2+-binding EF-hand superfamily protein
MKNHLPTRLLAALLVSALALPAAALAAKGDKKKDRDERPAAAFGKMDTDKNGSISESEFVTATKDRSTEATAKSRFASLDKNSDGKLDKKELAGAKSEGEKKRGERKKKNQE